MWCGNMDYSMAFKKFFGISPENISENVIVTNIMPIYKGIITYSTIKGNYNIGFYENVEIQIGINKRYQIIKITSGNAVIDVIKLLTMYVKKILFVGIAGCLDSGYKLGDVCLISRSSSFFDRVRLNPNTIFQTDGLIQSQEFYLNLKKQGIKFVDMECYDVFELCKNNFVQLDYIVQISDFPLETPFYEAVPQPINIKEIMSLIGDD